jgi:hypothetical protein
MNIFSNKVKIQKLVDNDLRAASMTEFNYNDLKIRIEMVNRNKIIMRLDRADISHDKSSN